MKLTNSLTEKNIKENIIHLTQSILNSKNGLKIRKILESKIEKIESIFILECIPDETEKTYTILLNREWVVSITIDGAEENIEEPSFIERKRYLKNMKGRQDILKIMIAHELTKTIPFPSSD